MMKAYPAYKDSGLAWLGVMPSHWEVSRGKWLFKRMNRPIREGDEIVTAFRDGSVTLRRNRREEGFTNSILEIGYQGIRKGDLVIHAMDAFAGAIGVSDSDGKSTPVYAACVPYHNANSHFYARVLRCMSKSGYIETLSKGIRERSSEFRFVEFASLEYPVPPREEQDAIVAFLEGKQREMDAFIANKQRTIALLQEQKAALINRAVTRGLDPDAPLKTSGVDWLGEVPAHWQIYRLGQLAASLQTGPFGSQLHSEEYIEGGIPIINPSHMKGGLVMEDRQCTVTEEKWETLQRHAVKPGDIIFARRGELGRCVLITERETGWLCGTGSLRMETKPNLADDNFLITVLSGKGVAEYLSLESVGATMDNLNPTILSRLPLPLPPLEEQRAIIAYINEKEQRIEQTANLARREIALMQEYRAALIAEVVTGRIDVRSLPSDRLAALADTVAAAGFYASDYTGTSTGEAPPQTPSVG